MQFKNILASIAALAVASAVASPLAVEKRDGQDAAVGQIIFEAAQAAKQHAGQVPTQEQLDLWDSAVQTYGRDWCPRCVQPNLSQPCTVNTWYALYCYQAAPQQWSTWGRSLYWNDDAGNGNVNIDHSFNSGILNGNSLSILDNLHIL